ncbi:ATP synthase protein I [Marinospirillum celere]|uniref:ATP synthase protein I n=1 Tax=Marinospirillum celere TaxID=1122252 RepID=A0A1I1I6W1_9GAMM|nr:ATP synthase protein I [Marinospirillum celere]
MAAVPLPPVKRLLLAQLLVSLLAALIAGLINPSSALDALLGGLIALIPQLVFSSLTFRYRGARKIGASVQLLLVGATLKFGLTVVLFALVFIGVQPSNPISLLCAYIAVLSVHWLAPWLLQKKA